MQMLYLCVIIYFLSIGLCFMPTCSERKINGRLERKSTDSVKGIAIIGIFLSHVVTFAEMGGISDILVCLEDWELAYFFHFQDMEILFLLKKPIARSDGLYER